MVVKKETMWCLFLCFSMGHQKQWRESSNEYLQRNHYLYFPLRYSKKAKFQFQQQKLLYVLFRLNYVLLLVQRIR